MYPPDADVRVSTGRLRTILEGGTRPGHFEGVCTVVAKLFNIVSPTIAFFGQKDAQQVAVIKQMVRDLSIPVRVDVCATVRESDGLALSSRNAYLSPQDRAAAPVLYRSLERGAEVVRAREDARAVEKAMNETLASSPAIVDYARVVRPHDFSAWSGGTALLLVAAKLGGTRLIDNLLVGESDQRGDTP